jgi:hypothetical protein
MTLIPCSACFGSDHVEVPGTRLDQASCTSSWRRITCPIFSARISCVWKGTRRCSTNTSRRSGRRLTTVIAVAIQRAYSRWVPARPCISTCSKQHRRTNAMGRVNRLPRMSVGRYVAVPALTSHSIPSTTYSHECLLHLAARVLPLVSSEFLIENLPPAILAPKL